MAKQKLPIPKFEIGQVLWYGTWRGSEYCIGYLQISAIQFLEFNGEIVIRYKPRTAEWISDITDYFTTPQEALEYTIQRKEEQEAIEDE